MLSRIAEWICNNLLILGCGLVWTCGLLKIKSDAGYNQLFFPFPTHDSKTTEQLTVQADPQKGSSAAPLTAEQLSQGRHVLQLIQRNPAPRLPPSLMETVFLLSSRQLLTSDTPFHPPKTYPIHPATLQIFPVSGSAPCHYGHPDNGWVSRCGDASLPVSVEYHRPNEWVNQHEETPPESLIHLQQNYVPLEIFVVFVGLIRRNSLHMLQSPSVMLSDLTCLRKSLGHTTDTIHHGFSTTWPHF